MQWNTSFASFSYHFCDFGRGSQNTSPEAKKVSRITRVIGCSGIFRSQIHENSASHHFGFMTKSMSGT
jgi:hypothetical protein